MAKDSVVVVLEKGNGWYKVKTSNGIVGYASADYLAPCNQVVDPPIVTPPPVVEPEPTVPEVKHTNMELRDSNLIAEPDVSVLDIKQKYSSAIVKNKNGEVITDENTLVGTGSVVNVDGVDYVVVKLGDVSGDGEISPLDYVKTKNHIMNVSELDGCYKSSADINKDGDISPLDYVKIKNHIMNVSKIVI